MWPLLCLFYVCVYLSKCLGGVVHTRPHSLSWYEGFFFFTNGIPEVVCGLCTPLVYVFGVTLPVVLGAGTFGPSRMITDPGFCPQQGLGLGSYQLVDRWAYYITFICMCFWCLRCPAVGHVLAWWFGCCKMRPGSACGGWLFAVTVYWIMVTVARWFVIWWLTG